MLMGEFERSIDAKGRLIIPAKFRDQLGASLCSPVGWMAAFSVIRLLNGTNSRPNLQLYHWQKKMLEPLPDFFFLPQRNVISTSRDESTSQNRCSNMLVCKKIAY